MEHMKEMEMPVSEQVFHSLIYGHSKLGNFESAERVMVRLKYLILKLVTYLCTYIEIYL